MVLRHVPPRRILGLSNPADQVVVFVGKPIEGGRLRSLLESQGIVCALIDEHISSWEPWMAGEMGTVKLVVPRSLAKRAAELLPVRRARA